MTDVRPATRFIRVDFPVAGRDGVALVTIDRPEARNALSDALLDDLLAAFAAAKADDSVRVVVLTSSHERVFSAGGDLKAFAGDTPVIEKYAGLDRFPKLFTLIGAYVGERVQMGPPPKAAD